MMNKKNITMLCMAVLFSWLTLNMNIAQSKLTELETKCDITGYCYTILKSDFVIPTEFISSKYNVNLRDQKVYAIPDTDFNFKSGTTNIKGMDIKVIDKSTIRIEGNINLGSSNHWGLKLFGDDSFWGSTWWNSTFYSRVNLTITNTTETPNDYSVLATSTLDLGNVCGIRIVNGTNETVSFGFQDNGDNNLDVGENITFRVISFPATGYAIYYNNTTSVSCKNATFNAIRYQAYFFDTLNTSLWDTSVYDSCSVSSAGGVLTMTSGGVVNYDRCGITTHTTVFPNQKFIRAEWDMKGQRYGRLALINNSVDDDSMNKYMTAIYMHDTSNLYYQLYNDGSDTASSWAVANVGTAYHHAMLISNATYQDAYTDGTFENSYQLNSLSIWNQPVYVDVYETSVAGYVAYFDNITVRHYTSPEPSVTLGSSEVYTTTSSSTTTTSTSTTIALNITDYTDYFCQGSDKLIKNYTYWNGTDYLSQYNATYCEYNCSETLLGTKCNIHPVINEILIIGLMVLLFGIVMFFRSMLKRVGV